MEERNDESLAICKKCGKIIRYSENDISWDYKGYGYDTKLIKCPCCNTPNILNYIEDRWLSE